MIAGFCRLLREHGVPVGTGESVDALRALGVMEAVGRAEVYLALRTALVKRVADYPAYDAAFRRYFDGDSQEPPAIRESGTLGSGGGYTPDAGLLDADMATVGVAEAAELERAAAWVARQLVFRLSRRRRAGMSGRRVDLRRTVRLAARRGGPPMQLVRSRRRMKRGNLALLLDMSGSMAPYSQVLAGFASALSRQFRRAQTSCFSTELGAVGGGTRIGAALSQFCAVAALGRGSAVIILSDGLDTGEPGLVAEAMGRIRRRAGRVIWLNPLAGDPQFQPLARAMAAALPYLDVLAPGHSLASLLRLGELL